MIWKKPVHLLGALVTAFAIASALPSCGGDQKLSPAELQALKREEIRQAQGTLTAEEETRISFIRANSRSEFESQVKPIRDAAAARRSQEPSPGKGTE